MKYEGLSLTYSPYKRISGDNTITAEAVDANDNTAQEGITIHTDIIEQPITISVTPRSGIAPLSTTFSIDTNISGTITTYRRKVRGQIFIIDK